MLPKERRLRSKREFDRVYREGRVLDRPEARIIWCSGTGRSAFVAAKKLGSLAARNRVRRRWREAARQLLGRLPTDVDFVVVVKSSSLRLRGADVTRALEGALDAIPN